MFGLELGARLDFLLDCPHGCIEQTVSAVFPQLYLPRLLELTEDRKVTIETNVKTGLTRLQSNYLCQLFLGATCDPLPDLFDTESGIDPVNGSQRLR